MCMICVQHQLGKLTDAEALKNAVELTMGKQQANEHLIELVEALIDLNAEKE